MWNMVVRKTTGLTIANDVRPAYFKLCEIVNEYEFNGQLSNYPELFPTEQRNNGPKWENRLRMMIQKIWRAYMHIEYNNDDWYEYIKFLF